ncbi:MAG: nucleotidyltransferase domain-containing protein, partial [Patescibacteria group bacterium]
ILITKKFANLVKKQFPVEKTYLFGSYAKNLAQEHSDIDICVVSPSFGKDIWEEESRLRKISLKVDSRIWPVAMSTEDIKDRYSQLAYEIKKYGIQV